MTYPPQQPEDGWSDQQEPEPIDPFAPQQGNQGQPAPQQGYGQPQQPQYPPQQGYPQQPEYPQQQPQQPYPPQQQPQYPQQPYPQGYPQQVDQNGQPIYYPQQPAQPAYPQHEEPPTDQTQSIPPSPHDEQGTQVIGQPPVVPMEQPYSAAPVSVDPASAQPYSGQPYSAQPYSAQPYSAQPFSAQPYSGAPAPEAAAWPGAPAQQSAPPGVPESPFATSPQAQQVSGLPAPVSASPTSSQPWGGVPVPQFVPKKQRKGPPGWLYVVGVLVVVAALAVGGAFYFGFLGGGKPTSDGSASPSGDTGSKSKFKSTLITDDTSGLGFMSLPKPWKKAATSDDVPPGFKNAYGQIAPVDGDKGVPGLFLVGEVDRKKVKYKTVSGVDETAARMSGMIDKAFWKAPSSKKALDASADGTPRTNFLRVDGHRGAYVSYHVKWDSSSMKDQGADVYVGLFDLPESGKLAGFVAAVPQSLSKDYKLDVANTVMTLEFK